MQDIKNNKRLKNISVQIKRSIYKPFWPLLSNCISFWEYLGKPKKILQSGDPYVIPSATYEKAKIAFKSIKLLLGYYPCNYVHGKQIQIQTHLQNLN